MDLEARIDSELSTHFCNRLTPRLINLQADMRHQSRNIPWDCTDLIKALGMAPQNYEVSWRTLRLARQHRRRVLVVGLSSHVVWRPEARILVDKSPKGSKHV